MRSPPDNHQESCNHSQGFERAELYPGDPNAKYVCKNGCGAIADKLTKCPTKVANGYARGSKKVRTTPQSYNIKDKHLVRWGKKNAAEMGRPKSKNKKRK